MLRLGATEIRGRRKKPSFFGKTRFLFPDISPIASRYIGTSREQVPTRRDSRNGTGGIFNVLCTFFLYEPSFHISH